jgi:hypothetical protein
MHTKSNRDGMSRVRLLRGVSDARERNAEANKTGKLHVVNMGMNRMTP